MMLRANVGADECVQWNVYTLNSWLERYDVIFKHRNLADATYKVRRGQIAIVSEKLGGMVLSKITTRHVTEFLEF